MNAPLPLAVSAPAAPGIDTLKAVWANVASPVGVVTLGDPDGRVHGTTITAFSSISFDPPLLMIALAHSSSFLQRLHIGRTFALNVMSHAQEAAAMSCATKAVDKMERVTWTDAGWGPFIEDAGAMLGCRVASMTVAGDHVIVLASFEHASSAGPVHGLLYWQRGFACSSI